MSRGCPISIATTPVSRWLQCWFQCALVGREESSNAPIVASFKADITAVGHWSLIVLLMVSLETDMSLFLGLRFCVVFLLDDLVNSQFRWAWVQNHGHYSSAFWLPYNSFQTKPWGRPCLTVSVSYLHFTLFCRWSFSWRQQFLPVWNPLTQWFNILSTELCNHWELVPWCVGWHSKESYWSHCRSFH